MLTDLESCGCGGGLGDASAAPEPPVTGTPVAVIALGAGAVALGIWALTKGAPRRRRARYTGRVAEVIEGDATTRLPYESMADVVFERRK